MIATVAAVIATLVSTIMGFLVARRIPVFPIVTVILALLLGGATLIFNDALFIKIKPTIGNLLFALTLLMGLFIRPSLLTRALEGQVHLTEKGWKVLTTRWAFFAFILACANEFVWRTQDTDTWVAFKACLAPVSIFAYIIITRLTAETYWQEQEINA